MSITRRIYRIFVGVMMLLAGVILIAFPEDGHYIVVFILDISLLLYGIKLLIYYFTMARFMVEGIMTLYKSIIVIDLGMFVFGMSEIPQRLTMLYLVLVLAFDGLVDVLKSIDTKKIDPTSGDRQFMFGTVKLIIAICCMFSLSSVKLMTYIFCIGLIHSALANIISAFRRTAMVYNIG